METNLETTPPKKMAIALRYGLITAAVAIIYGLILQFADLSTSQGLSSVTWVFLAVGIVFAYREFKRQNEGYMSYAQGLGLGTLTAAVTGAVASIFQFIYLKFIDDSMLAKIAEVAEEQRAKMESQGVSEEQIEQTMAMSERFSTPEMILVFGILGFIFFGFLISLVVAAAMRNPRPEFE